MNSQHSLPLTKAIVNHTTTATVTPQQVYQFVICAVLGAISGGASVAVMISLVIISELFLLPTVALSVNATVFTIVATIVSCGVAWLVGTVAYRLFPSRFERLSQAGMQVILTFAVLISLLQSLLFMQGF